MKYQKTKSQRKLGNKKENRITVTKTGKHKDLESDEIMELYSHVNDLAQQDNKYDYRVLVTAQNALGRYWNLKGYQEDDMRFEDYEDYFQNTVKDPSKFSKFQSITFVVETNLKSANVNF